MPTRIAGLLLFLIGASAALPAYAQAPTPPQPPLLQRLFPQPTGLNGYEDFVMAADLIRDNKAFDEATDGNNTTLAVRRRALADPACARALALLREGLKKPIASPRTQMDETTVLPELTWFRALGRLLMVEQYVLLADG